MKTLSETRQFPAQRFLLFRLSLLVIGCLLGSHARSATDPSAAVSGLTPDSSGYLVVEKGQDYAVHRKVTAVTNSTGLFTLRTNEFTTLDHGLHYFEAGEWKLSQDLLEPFPEGAVARFGAYKTIFSSDLPVFDIATPDGKRILGAVRSIQLTDFATGKSVVLATVKSSAQSRVIPPNRVLYSSAFDGLEADVLYVWKHNSFSQNIILKENSAGLPAELNAASTRLEVVTELIEAPDPTISEVILPQQTGPALADAGLISFGQMLAVPGMAYPVANEKALNLTDGSVAAENAVHVLKQWHSLNDGRKFIIESVSWPEIEAHLRDLPPKQLAQSRSLVEVAQSRIWPKALERASRHHPIQLAGGPYRPKGYLVDLEVLTSSVSTKVFGNTTYYVPTTYAVTSSSSFSDATIIKFGPNGHLTLSGDMTSPSSGIVTLTVRDDDSIGDLVINAGTPPYTTDGIVSSSDWAGGSLGLYNLSHGVFIRRFKIRYAAKGIDAYTPYWTHSVEDCRFETDTIGVYGYYTGFNLVNNKVCNVGTTWVAGTGSTIYESGTLPDCSVVNATKTTGLLNLEPTITINRKPNCHNYIALFSMSNAAAIVKSLSSDFGATWSAAEIIVPAANGDPSAAFDSYGNLFLTYLASDLTIPVLRSTNNGLDFSLITTLPIPPGRTACDQPTIATGPDGTGASSVWVTYGVFGGPLGKEIYVAGAQVTSLGSSVVFSHPPGLVTANAVNFIPGDIAIGPSGQVAVAFQGDWTFGGPDAIYVTQDIDGLGNSCDFETAYQALGSAIGTHLSIGAQPRRLINAEVGLAWDRSTGPNRGRLYMVYTDWTGASGTDIKTCYYLGSGSWSTPKKVNDDPASPKHDQFFPRIAVDETTGNIGVSWYDCRNDSSNTNTQFFAAVSVDGGQSFSRNIQLQWGQSNSNAQNDEHDYGDYTGLDYYGGFLCPAWADNSNPADSQCDAYVARLPY